MEAVLDLRGPKSGQSKLRGAEQADLDKLYPVPRLTPREAQLLRLIAEGMTQSAAGHALGISFSTVKSYLLHVFLTLDVQSQAAAVWAARRQLEAAG